MRQLSEESFLTVAEVAEALKLNQGSGTVSATSECVYFGRYAPARDGRLGSCVGGRLCPHCEPAAVVTSQNLRNFSQPRVATISRQEPAAASGQESVTLPRSPDTFDGLFVIALPRRRVTDGPPGRCLGRRLHGPPLRATAHRFGAMRTQRRVDRRVEDPTSERPSDVAACESKFTCSLLGRKRSRC